MEEPSSALSSIHFKEDWFRFANYNFCNCFDETAQPTAKKMRTALKQRFEGVWSKTNQEVLQYDSDMDSLFLCLLLVSCLSLSTHLFAKQTQKAQIIIFRKQENLGYTASEMFSGLRARSKKGFS